MEERNNICFAFAIDKQNDIQKKHFGDAEKYMICSLVNNEFIDTNEELNTFRNFDELQAHGSNKKGNAIIEFLKSKGVEVLVSQQSGKNIKLVNQHFIPVVTNTTNINKAKQELLNKRQWLNKELTDKKDNFNILQIESIDKM